MRNLNTESIRLRRDRLRRGSFDTPDDEPQFQPKFAEPKWWKLELKDDGDRAGLAPAPIEPGRPIEILKVQAGSAAAEAGITRGCSILSLNDVTYMELNDAKFKELMTQRPLEIVMVGMPEQ